MTRGAERAEGPDLLPVRGQGDRHAEQLGPLRVISMRVRKNNPLNAVVSGPPHGIQVGHIRGPGIDHPAAHHVRVRSVQGQGRGVRCADASNALRIDVLNRHLEGL